MIRQARLWTAACAGLVVLFLATVAAYYHPGAGFTAFINFPANSHHTEIPAVRNAPHVDDPTSGGYDGQFYAQFAVDPLLRDPTIDGAMDLAPYRARRILISWIAYAAGLGRPAWILQAYSLVNVVAWLALAWLLTAWIDPRSPRGFVLWAGVLLSHGVLSSVRYALTDLPAAVLIAGAVLATDRRRPVVAALVVGTAGLARETAMLGAAMLISVRPWLTAPRGDGPTASPWRRPRTWLVALACALLVAAPLALWIDYLRSIYRSLAFAGADHLVAPFSGLWWKVQTTAVGWTGAPKFGVFASTLAVVGFGVQSWVTVRAMAARASAGGSAQAASSPWALTALPFIVLALVSHQVVWAGSPGAFTRVLLPLSIGANVLLANTPGTRWPTLAAANLQLVPGILLFGFGWA